MTLKGFNLKGFEGIMCFISDRTKPLFCCDKCKTYFGFFYYSVRLASYKVIGENLMFSIKCRKCKHISIRRRIK